MTPSARLQAAAEILDRVAAGAAMEQALTSWARASRYAGSGDRAAVRDLVFEATRCRRSFAALGGAETGRGLMLGLLRARGEAAEPLFTGAGHSPERLDDAEKEHLSKPVALDPEVALDVPDWLAPALRESLGADYAPVMQALRHRAPVFLRANLGRLTREETAAALAREGIVTRPHPLAKSALEVLDGTRKLQSSAGYLGGLVELQDAASQAIIEALPLDDGARVLDYCAGGGGKILAMAARARIAAWAHDADPARMRDLPARAARAGVTVTLSENPAAAAPYDLVLADVPCSGSGSWRRAPEAKWRLTPDRLAELCALQETIARKAAELVRPGGHFAYATCSLLAAENTVQAARIAALPGLVQVAERRLTPLDGGDGFFLALFRRESGRDSA